MPYQPTNWQANDIVTAEKMNKLEQGISANEPLILTITNGDTRFTLNASYNDLKAAYIQGKSIIAIYNETEDCTDYSVCSGMSSEYSYGFRFKMLGAVKVFHASSATDLLYVEKLM